jgi:hypothetical protein
MAQTRKKRRSKHRGTAAGTIEARGRTGRKLTETERGSGGKGGSKSGAAARRANRFDRAPTWKSAFLRALFASVLLFAFTRIGFGPDIGIGASLALCVLALLIYVPLGYATDLFIYRRRQRKLGATSNPAAGPGASRPAGTRRKR